MKRLVILFSLVSITLFAQPKVSEISTMPGAFSRMGFGARGMGMGNAMSAVTEGNLVSYYNPAVIVFQKDNSFQSSYSILSLDRSLNFLSFTRKFDFYSSPDVGKPDRKPRSTAGVSLGVINSGVSNIEERDNNGTKTGDLSTSENQFFIGLANRFSQKVSIGLAVKFFYYKLYDKISSSGFGLDIGALYKVNGHFNVSLMLTDLNSKYKWDSTPLYGQDGTNTEDKFPLLKKLGVSYTNKDLGILGSVEIESSNAGTNYLRAGVEYNIYDAFIFKNGI